jgi:hypothetical protein
MPNGLCNLHKNLSTLGFIHVDSQLDVIEEIHARETMWHHLNVVIDVIFEEIGHFNYVGVSEVVAAEIVEDMNLKRDGA